MGVTQEGMILGTAAYMAPEQARGKSVDKRADIWAFGVVLYEMLTGRRAFDGEDVSSILAAVIQSEPSWDGVPASVRRLLESCLEKDPRKRLRDIGDVWKLLDDGAVPAPSRSRGSAGWNAAGALAVVAAIALWAPWRGAARLPERPVVRLDVDLGPDVSLVPLVIPTFSSVIISPDATRLVYVASVSGGPARLVTRRLDQGQATELPGTVGAMSPFFSPDGQWIGFSDGNKRICKIPVEGGSIVPLGDFPVISGGSWGDDGNIVVGGGLTTGLFRVPSSTGAASPILDLANGELFHSSPHVFAGGRAVLFSAFGAPLSPENSSIDVVSIADRRRKTVVRRGVSPRYVASGHLLYIHKGTMFAIPFDLDTMETRGNAVAVLDDVAEDPMTGSGQFDVSRGGTLVYRRSTGGAASSMTTVQWLDAAGKHEPLLAKPAAYSGMPRVSPDGGRVAMSITDGTSQDIWVYDSHRDAMTRLTSGADNIGQLIWSRDSRYVVYGSVGNGIFWTRADGAGQPQVLVPPNKSGQHPSSFTPDGKRLAYVEIIGFPQLWTVPVENEGGGLKAGRPERFLTTQFQDIDPAFSPDGRWISYQSTESGRPEVYVRAFPAPSTGGARWQISDSGGASPRWSGNGRELLYRAGDQIMAVEYAVSGDSFVAEKPRVWAASLGGATAFDLAPDGKRLVVLTPAVTRDAPKQEHTVVFVQNFFAELRRRVSAGQ